MQNQFGGVYVAMAAAPQPYHHSGGMELELAREVKSLRKQADWMERLFEDDERQFTYGDDGTLSFGMSQGQNSLTGGSDVMFSYTWALSQCMFRPSYGAAFMINEMQHRWIRARSRAFASQNPYWHGVQRTFKTHVVGKGHKWTVVPRHPSIKVPPEKLAKTQKEVDEIHKGYRKVQCEKVDRRLRDGEFFLQFMEEDQRLRVRFIEPLLVWTPPAVPSDDRNEILFGIQYRKGDYEKPRRYHVRTSDWLGGQYSAEALRGGPPPQANNDSWIRGLDPSRVQHGKSNVDDGTPRGIPETYWVQGRLEQALRTLRAMGTLVQVRTKLAIIRKRLNALEGSVTPMLSSQAAMQISTGSGQVRNVLSLDDGSIVDMPDSSEWSVPTQNLETDKITAAVQAELQSVASDVGLADYMISGSLSRGGYAIAMVAEGPIVKNLESCQQDMIEEDEEVVTRGIEIAIKHGRLDEDTLDLMKVEMAGPPLAGQNAIQDAQARQIQKQEGVLSVPTWQHQVGLDPEVEQSNQLEDAEHQREVMEKSTPPEMLQPAGGAGNNSGSKQPRNRQTRNARPFSPDEEPRQIQRASGRSREEEFWEHSSEPQSQEKPTNEDLAMSDRIITPEWLIRTKNELSALPITKHNPRDDLPHGVYEKGIAGVYLGIVDEQEVWAVDFDAIVIRHDAPDIVAGGNDQRYPWLPKNKIVVDWSYPTSEALHVILHECVERALMMNGWSYSRAHRYANQGPGCEHDYLLSLRPDLATPVLSQ